MNENDSLEHPLSDFFNKCLQDYQEDIKRIIGKYRYQHHHLEAEEIASRANLMLLKKREDILREYEGVFDEKAFSKIAYTYCRNIIGWSHSKENKSKYVTQRNDSIVNTEEGFKTSFEAAIETEGYEEEGFEAFDSNEKFTVLLHVIKEYCHILTEGELKILSCLESGMTHEEISNKFKFTRQAVSAASLHLFEKIKNHFSSDVLNDDTSHKVSDGNQAIKDFFNPEDFIRITKADRSKLKKFLLANVKAYTAKEVSKHFMDGKYNSNQIFSFCVRNNLNFCLNCPPKNRKFTKKESLEIAKLYNEGKNAHEIGEIFGVEYNVISGKKGHLSRLGLINEALA